MSSYQVVNFVSAISNAHNSLKYSFFCPRSKTILEVLKILKKEGYITHFQTQNDKESFKIFLKQGNGSEKSDRFKLMYKPSLKKYFSKKEVWKFSNNIGMFILTTPFGILSDRDAKLLGTGGKVLLYVH
jgi:small subunit ribosomal protein S8